MSKTESLELLRKYFFMIYIEERINSIVAPNFWAMSTQIMSLPYLISSIFGVIFWGDSVQKKKNAAYSKNSGKSRTTVSLVERIRHQMLNDTYLCEGSS